MAPSILGRVIGVAGAVHPHARRFTLASTAFALADLVVGCTIFGIAAMGILASFGLGWIVLASEYSAHALQFGTAAQFRAAAGLLLVCPIFAVEIAWLGYRAFQLPRRLWRMALEHPSELPRGQPQPIPTWSGSNAPVPMSEGALWAVRSRGRPTELRYVSLLVGSD
jgi:hypothetical protein